MIMRAVVYWLKKAIGKHAESLIKLFALKKGTEVDHREIFKYGRFLKVRNINVLTQIKNWSPNKNILNKEL